MSEAALVAFAKDPTRSQVKTRLELSENERSSIYAALLEDCLTQLCSIESAKTYVSCHPDKDSSFFSNLKNKFAVDLINQSGADLGKRMLRSFEELLAIHERVIVFGTDVPHLPVSDITSKLECEWDVLIGPSEDGGYYAIGLSSSYSEKGNSQEVSSSGNGPAFPNIFANVEWSSGNEYQATLDNCHQLNLKVQFLEPARDIDTSDDIKYYASKIEKSNHISAFQKALVNINKLKQVRK